MSFKETGIIHRKIAATQVAYLRYRGQPRQYQEIAEKLDELLPSCAGIINGSPIIVNHYGTTFEGQIDIEVCVPVSRAVDTEEITTQTLERTEAFTLRYQGLPANNLESYRRLSNHLREHGLPGQEKGREVLVEFDPARPENNVIEIQALIHPWHDLLAENLNRVLGSEAAQTVLQGSETINLETAMDERAEWVKGAMARLDTLADEDQKFDILTRCAHVFPPERIAYMRGIYERNHDVDEVLEEMHKDRYWYDDVYREGNIIYAPRLQPADPAGYAQATTPAEKRMAACFCPIIRRRLDSGISPTFCCCSAGWFTRLWEGILGQPVRVEILKLYLQGDDMCLFAIHLPV